MRKEFLRTEVGVDRVQICSEGGGRSRLQSPETSRGKSGLSRDGTWPHLTCSSSTLPSQASILNVPSCPTLPVPPGGGSPAEPLRVLGLLHEELHGPGPLGALSSLAQTEVTLSGTVGRGHGQRCGLWAGWFAFEKHTLGASCLLCLGVV